MTSNNDDTVSQEQKEVWYETGNYLFPVPPVCTQFWGRSDWMRYIDQCGKWNPQPPKTITINYQTWELCGFDAKGMALYRLPEGEPHAAIPFNVPH